LHYLQWQPLSSLSLVHSLLLYVLCAFLPLKLLTLCPLPEIIVLISSVCSHGFKLVLQ
jgi:hypothetical protein